MSTRATIVINNENGERAIAIYNHSDGYIHRGLGATVFAFMRDRVLVNGYNSGKQTRIQVNGLGDLGAQLVTELKGSSDSVGNVYIMTEGEEIHDDVEYIYHITPNCKPSFLNDARCPTCGAIIPPQWEIKVVKDGACIFTGTPQEAIKHFGRNRDKPLF